MVDAGLCALARNRQCDKPEPSCAIVVNRFYLILRLILQPLARNIYSRRRYDNSLYPASIGDGFNGPHPTEMAIFIEIPISAPTFCDLYAPMIVIRRNCENKCNRSRHDHSAQNSNEKYASHFVCPHTLTLSSKATLPPVLYLRAEPEATLVRAIIAHSSGLAYPLRQVAESEPSLLCRLARGVLGSFDVWWYDQTRPEERLSLA